MNFLGKGFDKALEKLSHEVLEEGAALIGADPSQFAAEFGGPVASSLASLLPVAAPPATVALDSVRRTLDAWRAVGWDAARGPWDDAGLAIAAAQEAAPARTSRVAELVRAAKTALGPTASSPTGPLGQLLAGVKAELEATTKRAKTAESAFLSAYGVLRDAPDPTPALAAALDVVAAGGDTMGAVALAQEVTTLRAECDRTRGAVEAAMRAQAAAADAQAGVARAISAAREAAARDAAADLEASTAREAVHADRAAELQRAVEALTARLDATQATLYEATAAAEAASAAKTADLDAAVDDATAARERCAVLERATAELRAQLAARPAPPSAEEIGAATRRDALIVTLREELAAANAARSADRAASDAATRAACDRAESAEAIVSTLRAHVTRLSPAATQVEKLRARVAVLRAVAGGGGAEEGDDDDDDDEEGTTRKHRHGPRPSPAASPLPPMAAALEAKCRRLGADLAEATAGATAAVAALSDCRAELAEQTAVAAAATSLVGRLEADLLRVGGGGAQGATAGADPPPAVGSVGGESSFLAVIIGQRERLRQRGDALEEELARSRAATAVAVAAAAAARTDSVKLYEKAKYLEAYAGRGGPGGTPGGGGGGGGEDPTVTARQRRYQCGPVSLSLALPELRRPSSSLLLPQDAAEAGAAKMYSERMDPFATFLGEEAAAARGRLRLHDRLALGASRLIAGSGAARLGIVIYVLLLHGLVMASLYGGVARRACRA